MTRKILNWLVLAIVATLVALLLIIGVAQSANVCGPREDQIATFDKQFRETIIARGLTTGGEMAELVVSPKGSWTFALTNTRMLTCVLASGHSWEVLKAPGEDS